MKIGFTRIDLSPISPTHKFAPLGEGIITSEVKDELVCRVSELENDDGSLYIHLSCPYGDVDDYICDDIRNGIERALNRTIVITIAVTHTHYAPKLNQEKEYADYVIEKLIREISNIERNDYGPLKCVYQRRYFDKVGRVRISGEETTNLYLETFSIFSEEKRILTYIIYNSHPTTLNFNEHYFSGAGPAVLLKSLEQEYPNEFFSYMIGAAGDVSTRFVRKGQNYEDVLQLTQLVKAEVQEQLNLQIKKEKVDVSGWKAEEVTFPVDREPRDMSLIDATGEMTPREKETLEIAKKKHAHVDLDTLPRRFVIQEILIGKHEFIYTPFELFSSYLNSINLENTTLVNLANGHGDYLSGPGIQKLSFEVLGETIPDRNKKELEKLLHDISYTKR